MSQSKRKRGNHTTVATTPGVAEDCDALRSGEKSKISKKKMKAADQKTDRSSWTPSSAGGFKLVPLHLGKGEQCRYLYIRQHRAGPEDDEIAQEGRTLFVTNLSGADDAEGYLFRLFGRCGVVESVTLKSLRRVVPASQQQNQHQRPPLAHHGAPTRGPWLEVAQADDADARPLVFAHVTFATPDGLSSALTYDWGATADVVDALTTLPHPKRGVSKWLVEYDEARPDSQRVLAEVDAFMADFDRKQRLAEQEEEAALGKPDADGFITVRRKGRKKVADGGIPVASAKAAPALAAKAQRQESENVLLDFYRFQRRENRRKQLADLRLRFEEDKKKIAKLRAQRKFKPF